MIKLTINPNSHPETVLFQQPLVTIGSGNADLALPQESLQNCHIKIVEEENRFIIINVANDPFATLNSLPFGKKALRNQDLLKLGNTEILFDGEHSQLRDGNTQADQVESPQEVNSPHLVLNEMAKEDQIHSQLVEASHLQTSSPIEEEKNSTVDIDALFREVEGLDDPDPSAPILQEEEIDNDQNDFFSETFSLETPKQHIEMSDEPPSSDYPEVKEPILNVLDLPETNSDTDRNRAGLKDSDEYSDAQLDKESSEGEPVPETSPSNWRTYLAFFVVVIAVASIIAAAMFVSVIDKSDGEEIAAAEAVSDVAMALAYAQVHHIKPQKQNWFDPDFLKNNLASVLSSEYPAFSHIDNQGQISNCHYILRIYTSSDLSQFLVMAQPEPSLLQWLIPKASIIVDSRAMEMRNINDLKALNRLLVNPNTLDGSNAVEISNLVRQGELIPLNSLAAQQGSLGFTPPKALALIRPGAENLIYNAPRYHHFGESIINRSVQLLQMVGNSHEIVRLQEEIAEISKFPNIVLYSSQGIQKAIQAQKALATFAPLSKFFTAYLNFNEAGLITSSHLVLNGDPSGFLNSPSMMASPSEKAPLSFQMDTSYSDVNLTAMNVPNTSSTTESPSMSFEDQTDSAHPLFLQLSAIAAERQQALNKLSESMISLMNRNNENGIHDFFELFSKLYKQYEMSDSAFREKITKQLSDLYQEYSEMPLAEFSTYVRKAGLGDLARDSLTSRVKETGSILTPKQFSNQMQHIQNAKNLEELDERIKQTADMLTLAHLPDPIQLIIYQNEMRSQTLAKLGQFMLTPNTLLPPEEFQQKNRATLSHILKTAWVTDPEEYDFYINEFELLVDHFTK